MEGSKSITMVTYEVLDSSVNPRNEFIVDWEDLFDVGMQNNQLSQSLLPSKRTREQMLEVDNTLKKKEKNMTDSLKQLSKEIESSRKEHADAKETNDGENTMTSMQQDLSLTKSLRKNEPRGASKERIPKGFSLRQKVPSCGRRARCAGCLKFIEYKDSCIRHRYRKTEKFTFDDIDNFHCRATCLLKLAKDRLGSFLEKKWVEQDVVRVVKEIQHLHKKE